MNTPAKTPAQIARLLEAAQQRITDNIATYGWSIMTTFLEGIDDNVAMSYTIGLTERSLPELIAVGMNPQVQSSILSSLAARSTKAGAAFTHGQRLSDVLEGYEAIIIGGSTAGLLRPSAAIGRYGEDAVQLQQLVWPDPEGRFPWDPGYRMPPMMQPTIGVLG